METLPMLPTSREAVNPSAFLARIRGRSLSELTLTTRKSCLSQYLWTSPNSKSQQIVAPLPGDHGEDVPAAGDGSSAGLLVETGAARRFDRCIVGPFRRRTDGRQRAVEDLHRTLSRLPHVHRGRPPPLLFLARRTVRAAVGSTDGKRCHHDHTGQQPRRSEHTRHADALVRFSPPQPTTTPAIAMPLRARPESNRDSSSSSLMTLEYEPCRASAPDHSPLPPPNRSRPVLAGPSRARRRGLEVTEEAVDAVAELRERRELGDQFARGSRGHRPRGPHRSDDVPRVCRRFRTRTAPPHIALARSATADRRIGPRLRGSPW